MSLKHMSKEKLGRQPFWYVSSGDLSINKLTHFAKVEVGFIIFTKDFEVACQNEKDPLHCLDSLG